MELNFYFDITTPTRPRLGGIAPDAARGAAFTQNGSELPLLQSGTAETARFAWDFAGTQYFSTGKARRGNCCMGSSAFDYEVLTPAELAERLSRSRNRGWLTRVSAAAPTIRSRYSGWESIGVIAGVLPN